MDPSKDYSIHSDTCGSAIQWMKTVAPNKPVETGSLLCDWNLVYRTTYENFIGSGLRTCLFFRKNSGSEVLFYIFVFSIIRAIIFRLARLWICRSRNLLLVLRKCCCLGSPAETRRRYLWRWFFSRYLIRCLLWSDGAAENFWWQPRRVLRRCRKTIDHSFYQSLMK